MNTAVEILNAAGRRFVEFSLPMLVQSCVLILILLAVDAFLKRRVRAVFRYWIWMLVLVKLVLPPSLGSPVSVGTWFGDTLEAPTVSLLEPEPPRTDEPQTAELPSAISTILAPPDPMIAQPFATEPAAPTETLETRPPVQAPAMSLSWQGATLLVWATVALALMLLLIQRAFFVRGLLGQSETANRSMLNELEACRRRLNLRRRIDLRLSPNATSPAVCGLLRPVILIPQSIAPRLQSHDLQAVLLHELAHVKRGDLWVNLVQTLLQIVYFYNPLLWLANAMIRRTREQAVDETVLVAMGETARQYPEILVNIAKLAFTRRPALSLRLIGVVESKSALTARIKHILARPLPKTARLGLLGLTGVFILAAVLLPMARATEGNASVDNAGPLGIRLVGVRPDGGDELYDAEGKRLSVPMVFLGDNIGGSWQSEDQRRDFILQAPHLNEPLLFLHTWIRAAGTDRTVGGGLVYSVGSEDPSTLILSSTLDREYRRLGGMIAAPTAPVARVDLPLKYFYGKARDALCTFTGPFVPGKVVQADAGRPFQLTPEAVGYGDGTLLKFRFFSDQDFEGSTWVLAYDKQGRRYLLDSGEDAQRYHGIDRPYQVNAVPWDQISAITVGEKAYEITFRNVVVRYPGRPARTHAAYLDVMAQRLGLTGMSPEQLRQYSVKNPQEAIAVLDVVRGDWHIRTTFEALERARPPIRVSELDAAAQQKIREVAARWAHSAAVSRYGIQLGLMGQWPEFFDMAMDRLERDYPADRFHYYYEQMRLEGNRQIAYALSVWWTELNAQQVERIKHLILDAPGDGAASNWLFWCLRKAKSQEVVDALWELAQDERPWIWWNALAAWYNQTARTRGGHYEDLPEKIRVRLFLVEGIPVDEALKAEALALLARILTPEVVGLSSDVGNQVLRKVMEGFDRETITQIFVESLRGMQSATTSRQWLVDYPRRSNLTSMAVGMIRTLNVWYGVDIGRLGANDATASSLEGPQTFTGFQALIAEALEWHRVNRGVRPLEMVFEGRVVDTAGRPVPAAELSLVAMERDGEGHRSSDNPQVVHGRTDADGRFVFKSPASTHHMLRVVAEGFAARERVSVGQLPDGRFYVSEGTGDNVIVLEKPSSLSGRVIGLDGRPLTNDTVHLWSYPTHAVPVLGRRVLDEQGRFTGDAVMSGHHLVRYGEREQTDGAREYEGVTAFSLVHVPEGQAVDDVVLDLRQSTAALEIEILGQDGRSVGVDHLALEIDMPSGRPRYAAVLFLQDVKPRPVHRFPNLPPMEGHVSVTVMGRPSKRVPVKLFANGTTRCRVLIDASDGQAVRAAPGATGPQANAAAREVVLPSADRQPMVLDLATGGLILMPSGPEPEKAQQVLREVGKGDILYDVDLGDRTLIFLRDAKSDPPGDDTGEPSVTGHLIKNLPETITVVTKGGRRYKVTILAADERGCTLKYSAVPADRGAGGDAPVEPKFDYDVVTKWEDMPPHVRDEVKRATEEGTGVVQGNFERFPERLGVEDKASFPRGPGGSPLSPYLDNDEARAGSGGGAPAEPGSTTASLELRIVPRSSDVASDVAEQYRKALVEGRPPADARYVWVPVRPRTEPPADSVTQTHEGKLWLLAHNQRPHIMVPGQTWRLAHVSRSADRTGRPIAVLRFDNGDGPGVAGLTDPNPGRPLAVVVNGVVVSAATIPQDQYRTTAVIGGDFTEREFESLIATLRKGIPPAPAGTDAGFRPVTLQRNGVTVELLGICESPSVGKQWWRPDGSPLAESPYDDEFGKAFPKPGERGYKFAVKLSGLAGKEVDADIQPSSNKTTHGGSLFSRSRKNGTENTIYRNGSLDEVIVWQGVAFDEELDSCDIRVGVSWGRWPNDSWYHADKPDDPIEWAVFRDVSLRPGYNAAADNGTGGDAPVEPKKTQGTLEFRIAPRSIDLDSDVIEKLKQTFADGSSLAESDFAWFPIRMDLTGQPFAITHESGGKAYVLLWNKPPHVILASQDWGLESVYRVADASRRPAIGLTFNDKGASLFHDLTAANVQQNLAIVIEGTVVAMPHISSPLGSRAIITGRFTEQEIVDLLAALRKNVSRPLSDSVTAQSSDVVGEDWTDLGEPIPADASHARTLAPAVVLDGIGQDVEGKVFVASIRDLDATKEREYRFVIRWKDGRVQEPRYRTTVDRFGRRLWEKFTFDAWYDDLQIESVRLQSRPVQEGRGLAIPSPKDEITPAAGTAKPAPATAAPPGRYALSFDGQGDYLYVPDSESLRKPQSLVIEVCIKPQFGPGPHEHRPGWGILAKGAYTGTGRVRVQGFDIRMDNFDPNANTVMLAPGQATEQGVSIMPTFMKLSTDWLHITKEFGDYIPASGQPLVIGRPLTPGDDPLHGQIAEIRIWDGTKAPDIRQYEDKALTGDEPGLVACWTFEEGGGQIAHDISPHANHARLGSSVAADDADPAWVDLSADSR